MQTAILSIGVCDDFERIIRLKGWNDFIRLPIKKWILVNLVPQLCDRGTAGWIRPPTNWYELDTDGAVKRLTDVASCGGAIHDAEEEWIMGFGKRIDICSALEAELWGIFEDLLTAWSLETDSLEAFRLLQGVGIV
ncbi:hypothetical protein V6N12_017601 [Hibiscus sabdariffa]|uniref:RNase H type-1 domain-containing protein n=1 Tax=Hibiscus sabdariffa TaxID=183260 RepID=A0ABR2CG19_9ROSI